MRRWEKKTRRIGFFFLTQWSTRNTIYVMQSLFQVMLHSKHQTCTFNLQNDTEVTIVWASHHSKDENDDLTKHTARGIFIGKHNLIQEAISAMLQPTMTMASSVQSMDSGNSTLGPPRFAQRPLAGTASVFSPSVTFCTALSLSVYYLSK